VIQELKRCIEGEVLSSASDLNRYSQDESIFSVRPTVVVAPKNKSDLQAIVTIAGKHRVPITARGAGTSVAGQAIGSGIVVDFTQHMNRVLDISDGTAIVEPGVVLDDLNRRLAVHGARFAPDPSSHAWCTIGGMVGNNASGPHSFKHGSTRQHVLSLQCVLADASVVSSHEIGTRFPALLEEVENRSSQIQRSVPATRKNSSGYALDCLLKSPPDFTGLLVGSEGTLALLSEIEIRTIPLEPQWTTAIISFSSLTDAILAVEEIRGRSPAAIELMDHYILDAIGRLDPTITDRLGLTGKKASLWIEWEGEVERPDIDDVRWFYDPKEQNHIWKLRSLASKELQKQPGPRRPLRCIEDGVVPLRQLDRYVLELRDILRSHDCDGAIFGHVGDAHIHVNPNVDVEKPYLPARIERLMDEAYGLISRLGGSISGEHGDGILRSKYLAPDIVSLKRAFDPDGIFNKGVKTKDTKTLSYSLNLKKLDVPFCLANPVPAFVPQNV
jgi:FAD/FMN-containing dehydrogenase